MHFISPTVGRLSLEAFSRNIKSYLEQDPKAQYKVVIGTDSQTSQKSTLFVTAFIIHRVGKGARFYFRRHREKPIHDLRYRIYKETEISLKTMEELKAHGITELLADWPVEVHLDIGQRGDTRKLIQEVVGWVTSVGYIAKIKPNSYGASAVADRFTK
ncbi:MAG: ribonuclease H-like YkuK family protein [Bacillaceae bacterium]|nr:ribonuclease H-like YkuK family protein [Bacillaceae bacterium]